MALVVTDFKSVRNCGLTDVNNWR